METKRDTLKAFTLIELLIVMGILIILMAVGVATARFALQRANKIAHQNAIKQFDQAFTSYYSDKRRYPDATSGFSDFGAALNGGALDQYVDNLDAGSDATFYYTVASDHQTYIVCVSLGGINDEDRQGLFCGGNGFGSLPTTSPAKGPNVATTDTAIYNAIMNSSTVKSDWHGDTQTFGSGGKVTGDDSGTLQTN